MKKPETYVQLINAGIKLDEIIVGNMTTMDIVKKINLNVACDQGDLDAFAELQKIGVKCVLQLTPSYNPEELKL